VFDCMTKAEHLARWWGPHHFDVPFAESEARPGGRIRLDMRGPEPYGINEVHGEYEVVDRPDTLVMVLRAFGAPDGSWGIEHRTRMEFTDAPGGGTHMHMTTVVLQASEELLPALGRSIEVWPARLAGLWRDAKETYEQEREALQGVYRALRPQPPQPVLALPTPPNPLLALDAALALDGFDVPRLVRRAQFSIGQPQREAQARLDLATALLLEPENPAALVQRARLSFRDGAFAAAQADAEAALRSEPRSIEALFQRARALTARGQLSAALKAYDDVVAVAPANAAALLNRALLLQHAREYERALADLDAAVAANRADPDGWVARAALRTALGQTDAAIADFDRALSLDARLGQAWYGRALAHQRRGDAAEAAADFARAQALDAQAEERYRAFGVAP